jgi:deazaflavin-dependent oxidoreductase (nitroreductase family)
MVESGTFEPRRRGAVERVGEAISASRPGAWFWVNAAPHVDRGLMRLSGGRLTTAGVSRIGLLRVKGAKTGALRETPLLYTRDGGRIIVIASRGGDVKHPAWYRNLVANPEVGFVIRGQERPYTARTLEGAEREGAWELACDKYAGYSVYQRRAAGRQIPVVALEPAGASP